MNPSSNSTEFLNRSRVRGLNSIPFLIGGSEIEGRISGEDEGNPAFEQLGANLNKYLNTTIATKNKLPLPLFSYRPST